MSLVSRYWVGPAQKDGDKAYCELVLRVAAGDFLNGEENRFRECVEFKTKVGFYPFIKVSEDPKVAVEDKKKIAAVEVEKKKELEIALKKVKDEAKAAFAAAIDGSVHKDNFNAEIINK